jgi:hypothetical protein
MAPADLLLWFVIALAPADDGLILGRLVFLVILVTGTIRIAHTFHVVRETHLGTVIVGWNSIRGSSSLEHIAHA